jgi:beta-mannosidase
MVDYYRRAKALLYHSKHFFAPIMVSGLPDAKSGQTDIYVTSDEQSQVPGTLLWIVTDLAGELLSQGSKQINILPRTSQLMKKLDLSGLIKTHGAANLLIWAEVVVDGEVMTRNTLTFGRPKELKLRKPRLVAKISGGETEYRVTIESDVPALWVWANVQDADAEYSDNFLDLHKGRSTQITIVLDAPMTPFDFRRKLQVRSVYDIAPAMRD